VGKETAGLTGLLYADDQIVCAEWANSQRDLSLF